MKQNDFTATIVVDQSPEEVFAAINNARGWWSEGIEGDTDSVGGVFQYRFQDVHRCTLQVTELVPQKRVVWHVLDNHFGFTRDETEWKDTDIVFEISRKGGKTKVLFTHVGLVPEYECYAACREGWTTYIAGSLRDLIGTGKGQPNKGEAMTAHELTLTDGAPAENFTTAFTVDKSPEEAFAAINNVAIWWTGEPGVEGRADQLGDEFTYRYGDVHYSKQKVTGFVPGKKVVWKVIDARLGFTKDPGEWKGTELTFEIAPRGTQTEVRFTHVGLVPQRECFDDCSSAWGFYANTSLRSLISAGKGQ